MKNITQPGSHELSGVLIIDKPRGWTSHDCVAVCRRALGVKRIGHGGTLDPMAEGLLPLYVGRAARITEYMDAGSKTYVCGMKLGKSTDTFDIWGRTTGEGSVEGITEDDVRGALKSFTGDIDQIPPIYSAIKVKGKKLYEYARKGETVDIKPRRVRIYSMDIKKIDLDESEVVFEVTCSKGTYIRSICSDAGRVLGCGAAMSYLRRTGMGAMTLDGALDPNDIKTMDREEIADHMMTTDAPLVHFEKVFIAGDRALYFVSGNDIRWTQVRAEDGIKENLVKGGGLCRVYRQEDGLFLGTGRYRHKDDTLKADKIFTVRQEL